MNPSDTFESFDMNNFDDFLARESLEEEANNSSAASSFTDSFEMMPVYRSLDVMMPPDLMHLESQRLSGLDMVFEAPVLSRHPVHQQAKEPVVHQPVDDLFAQLEADFAHTSLPCCHGDSETQPLEGIALSTSVEVNKTALSTLTTTILNFLQSRGVYFEHCELSSKWKCELTDFVDSCKFHIQIYSSSPSFEDDQEDFTVEFLRISGCSQLFSGEFQHFKSSQSVSVAAAGSNDTVVLFDVTPLAPKAGEGHSQSQQAALESFVKWASNDPAEATRAVCGLFTTHSHSPPLSPPSDLKKSEKKVEIKGKDAAASQPLSPLLRMTTTTSVTGDQMSSEGILVMTLLGALCMQFQQLESENTERAGEGSTAAINSSSALPLLSLLHLLLQTRRQHSLSSASVTPPCSTLQTVLSTLINSLTPASARLANSSSSSSHSDSLVSACERQSAIHLMAMIRSNP